CHAIGEIDVEFAAVHPQLLGFGLEAKELLANCRAGIAGQEGDEQLAGLDAAPLCERISCDRASQIGSGPQNYRRTKTKAPLDCLFDPLGQRNQVALVSSENNVAALHVGLRIKEA